MILAFPSGVMLGAYPPMDAPPSGPLSAGPVFRSRVTAWGPWWIVLGIAVLAVAASGRGGVRL